MSHHIALLGDSIFDNQTYTAGEPDVVTHLSQLLPSPWRATLCAVDGATTNELKSQCPRTPSDASHLVVSIGGNDVLIFHSMPAFSPHALPAYGTMLLGIAVVLLGRELTTGARLKVTCDGDVCREEEIR